MSLWFRFWRSTRLLLWIKSAHVLFIMISSNLIFVQRIEQLNQHCYHTVYTMALVTITRYLAKNSNKTSVCEGTDFPPKGRFSLLSFEIQMD